MNEVEKILVVEYSEEARDRIRKYLVQLGYSVETAADGREGLDKFCIEKFQAVITGIFMPDMDGLELILALKEIRDVPVMVISELRTQEFLDYIFVARKMGADVAMRKPIDFTSFEKTIGMLCS